MIHMLSNYSIEKKKRWFREPKTADGATSVLQAYTTKVMKDITDAKAETISGQPKNILLQKVSFIACKSDICFNTPNCNL